MTLALLAGAIGLAGLAGCDDSSRIIVVHADSLSGPFNEVRKVFEAEHPGVRVELEPFGSVLACRKLQAGVPCDVVALADRHLFDEELAPAKLTTWSAGFATTEIVIIKSSKSRYNTEINSDNWFEILSRPDVKVGAADPSLDPCGYWTRMMWELADRHYAREGRSEGGTERGREKGDGVASVPPSSRPSVSPSLRPSVSERMAAKCTAEYTRPDSQQLISLVEGQGGWDYAFVYKAQAEQQRLSYVPLPPEINLGSIEPAHVKAYAAASVSVPGTKIVRKGEPLVFALSIPSSARNPSAAAEFVAFVFSERGRAICRQAGMPMLDKPWSAQKSAMPETLRGLVGEGP